MTEASARRVIRTPDQRLRVFVSSTLGELKPERVAAKNAVTALHLSPVMFELGARPHPPRELYRAYLEQSHIFVGIYWQRYGWVAPGEDISGLEDEYRLCGDRPKLVYVKTPAPEREDRLKAMLKDLQEGDTASYRPFETADELQQLLIDDLALMLTETFEASLRPGAVVVPPESVTVTERPRLPRPVRAMIGRERELAELEELAARPEVQLITLLGTGGIGKSRLAIALGERLSNRPDPLPTTFVDLSRITDPAMVVTAVAERLGIAEQEGRSRLETLTAAMSGTSAALILDNFEQIIAAGPGLAAALEKCPELLVIVTSRTPLRLAAETTYQLDPLPLPSIGSGPDQVSSAAAVQLFVARAQSVRPSFDLTADNADAVAELTRRLDGLPLALELAAARARLLSPAALLKRLDRRFDLLEGGGRDLPGRQQTLRATIDWSVGLLGPDEQRAFTQLAVFAGGWSLDAAEAVCDPAGDGDFLEHLATLVDNNLVVAFDGPQEGRFRMLMSLRAYATEMLEALPAGELAELRGRHAAYFLGLAEQAKAELTGAGQRTWLVRLQVEHDNLRAAAACYRDHPDGDALARLATSLVMFWWIRGHYSEGETWLRAAQQQLAIDDPLLERVHSGLGTLAWVQGHYEAAGVAWEQALTSARASGDDLKVASAMGNLAILAVERHDLAAAEPLLTEALALIRRSGEAMDAAPTLINLGVVMIQQQRWDEAGDHLREAVALFRAGGDHWRLATCLINLGDVQLATADLTGARDSYAESLRLAREIEDDDSTAYALEGLASLAARSEDAERAARLWGAAEKVRAVTGNPRPPTSGSATYEADVEVARGRLGPDRFTEAWTGGEQARLADVVNEALGSGLEGGG